jgi:glucuronate isomerase
VKNDPIISPHAHVPAEWYIKDDHFATPTELFITPDHYVTRLLHSQGIPLSQLGVNQKHFTSEQARAAFQLMGDHWIAFAGTPMRYWFEDSLERVFGITTPFGPKTAVKIYDQLSEMLALPEFSTRALALRFNMAAVSTTDDPTEDLSVHDQINHDAHLPYIVMPAFRPDQYLEPARADWPSKVQALGAAASVDTSTYDGFCEAMRIRRRYFKEHGAVLSDHSHCDVAMQHLPENKVRDLYTRAYRGIITPDDAVLLRRHLLFDQATFAQEDHLTMTVHPSVYRDYDPLTQTYYGHDAGGDVPARADFTHALKPMLNAYGNNPDFHFVAFTIDETVFSRELAPLAGFYPAMYVGAPWWFLDGPESIDRYFHAVVPYAGFTKLSGFIDDTRALCSIPSRHDMNRRLTASYIAGLVAQHRISKDDALELVKYEVDTLPRRVFKIDHLKNKYLRK